MCSVITHERDLDLTLCRTAAGMYWYISMAGTEFKKSDHVDTPLAAWRLLRQQLDNTMPTTPLVVHVLPAALRREFVASPSGSLHSRIVTTHGLVMHYLRWTRADEKYRLQTILCATTDSDEPIDAVATSIDIAWHRFCVLIQSYRLCALDHCDKVALASKFVHRVCSAQRGGYATVTVSAVCLVVSIRSCCASACSL